MRVIMPNYYKKFVCKADMCKDNCCKTDWRIELDEDTFKKYRDIPGELGKKLRLAVGSDEDGYYIVHPCPMLRSDGLCEAYLSLGDEGLGYICRMHPRYVNAYSDREELGIGLACEEAARLIMTETKGLELEETVGKGSSYKDDHAEVIIKIRSKITDLIKASDDIESSIAGILKYISSIEADVLGGEYESALDKDISPYVYAGEKSYCNISETVEKLLELEILDKNWEEILREAKKSVREENGGFDSELNRIFCYFIYRYFVEHSLDGQMLSSVKLAAVSVIVLRELFKGKSLSERINLAHMYSKEIEYSEENLENLLFDFFVDEVFEVDEIIKMLC